MLDEVDNFYALVVMHYLLMLCAKTDGYLLITLKLQSKKPQAYFFVGTVYYYIKVWWYQFVSRLLSHYRCSPGNYKIISSGHSKTCYSVMLHISL